MPKPVLVLRVVLASPGDVKAERDCVAGVLDEVNRDTAHPAELHLELSRWEMEARPGFHVGGPQGLIDPILRIEECDLVIGIFWSRMGTPTPSGETGTEHEFHTAYRSWTEKQRPEIMSYFCERPPVPRTDEDRAQIEMVRKFKANFPRPGFAWSYHETSEFAELLARHLRLYLRERIAAIWNKDVAAVRDMQRARALEPPLIAILGRITVSTGFDKPIADAPACRKALFEIGRELAAKGCRIMVYDSRDEYAAIDVVNGYLQCAAAKPGSIQIRRPVSLVQKAFPGQSAQPGAFLEIPVQKEQWEVAFIPSVSDADGVVMAGNGQFTLLGGLQAVGARLPIVAMAGYGGIAADVWEVLQSQRSRFANDNDIAMMALRDPGAAWAAAAAASLLEQKARRDALQIWRT